MQRPRSDSADTAACQIGLAACCLHALPDSSAPLNGCSAVRAVCPQSTERPPAERNATGGRVRGSAIRSLTRPFGSSGAAAIADQALHAPLYRSPRSSPCAGADASRTAVSALLDGKYASPVVRDQRSMDMPVLRVCSFPCVQLYYVNQLYASARYHDQRLYGSPTSAGARAASTVSRQCPRKRRCVNPQRSIVVREHQPGQGRRFLHRLAALHHRLEAASSSACRSDARRSAKLRPTSAPSPR